MEALEVRYNPVYEDFLTNTQTYNVLYGSAGSGKSVAIAQKFCHRLISSRGEFFLVFMKHSTQLREAAIKEFKNCLDAWEIKYNENLTEKTIEVPLTGSRVKFMGLDDAEKVKSISGVTSIWIEEANQISEENYDQIELRMRGDKFPSYAQYVISFNPVSETHWLKRRFFDTPPPDCYTLRTTYRDNQFLDAGSIARIEHFRITNPSWFRIYGLGQWGVLNRDELFYPCFDHARNVVKCDFNPDLAIHLSFDFNFVPHCTATVWQLEGDVARCIDEIALKSPNNNTAALCGEFINRYRDHYASVFIYGDVNGSNGDTRSNTDDYGIILNQLRMYHPEMRVPKSNPSVSARGMWLNNVLAGLDKVTVEIDPRCQGLIEDLDNLKKAPDGKKHKERKLDKKTGLRPEQYGHFSDTFDYLLCEAFKGSYTNYTRGSIILPVLGGARPSHRW